jgi:acetyl-CoA synthetase
VVAGLRDSRSRRTTWFVDGKVSIAHNCVHSWAASRPDALAAVGLDEDGARRTLTFAELSRDVTRLAEHLTSLGVGLGDRVAIYLPMGPEVAVASHAIAHLGAIQVPVFSGFAAPAVKQRLEASEAKVVITQESSSRRGKRIPMLDVVRETGLDVQVVLAPFELDAYPGELPALQVDSETPYLLTHTSSGTTGEAEVASRTQGGFLVSIAREGAYQADAHEGDVMLFATDMWGGSWGRGRSRMAGSGSAARSSSSRARLAADAVSLVGDGRGEEARHVAGTLADSRALIPHGDPSSDLSSLRTFVTTGEPWNAEPYRWLFETVGGSRVPVINCSGGTEVGACFLSPATVEPIKACSVGGPALGMAMDVFDLTATHSSAAARSASSSAASRSPA